MQHEQDEIYYMRARYYDADTGRFLKEDPIGFEGGINLHLYAGGNPVAFVDPSGLGPTSGGPYGCSGACSLAQLGDHYSGMAAGAASWINGGVSGISALNDHFSIAGRADIIVRTRIAETAVTNAPFDMVSSAVNFGFNNSPYINGYIRGRMSTGLVLRPKFIFLSYFGTTHDVGNIEGDAVENFVNIMLGSDVSIFTGN